MQWDDSRIKSLSKLYHGSQVVMGNISYDITDSTSHLRYHLEPTDVKCNSFSREHCTRGWRDMLPVNNVGNIKGDGTAQVIPICGVFRSGGAKRSRTAASPL